MRILTVTSHGSVTSFEYKKKQTSATNGVRNSDYCDACADAFGIHSDIHYLVQRSHSGNLCVDHWAGN